MVKCGISGAREGGGDIKNSCKNQGLEKGSCDRTTQRHQAKDCHGIQYFAPHLNLNYFENGGSALECRIDARRHACAMLASSLSHNRSALFNYGPTIISTWTSGSRCVDLRTPLNPQNTSMRASRHAERPCSGFGVPLQ